MLAQNVHIPSTPVARIGRVRKRNMGDFRIKPGAAV